MSAIHTPVDSDFQILRSEKTSFPKLLNLPAGVSEEDIAPGEFIGRNEVYQGDVQLRKITNANYKDQAKHAVPRINTTSNDVKESGAVTVQKGHFELKTKFYLAGENYNIGDLLTLRYSSNRDAGVLGPTESDTKFIVGRVERAPSNTSWGEQDMLQATMFDNASPTSNITL